MSQTADDSIVTNPPENTDPAETQETQADASPQGGAADVPPPAQPQTAQPAQPQRQPVVQRAPEYRPPERIVRARESIKKLDDMLSVNGQLEQPMNAIVDYTEELARENAALRVQLQQTEQSVSGLGFWQQHDSDPANAAYPSSQARADYLRIKQEVAQDPAYEGLDEQTKGIAMNVAARERFNNVLNQRRSGATNNTPETQSPGSPAAQVRTVGSTRAVPKGTRSAPPVPQRRLTVTEMLEQDALPPDLKAKVEQEFRDMR